MTSIRIPAQNNRRPFKTERICISPQLSSCANSAEPQTCHYRPELRTTQKPRPVSCFIHSLRRNKCANASCHWTSETNRLRSTDSPQHSAASLSFSHTPILLFYLNRKLNNRTRPLRAAHYLFRLNRPKNPKTKDSSLRLRGAAEI
jgi:hypothetical protein